MVEVAKPDYLSLVNKSGSGFNVSELVTSIVAAEIEPKKAIHNSKQEKNDNAISGLGFLNAKSLTTKTSFSSISNDKFFSVTSSSPTALELVATDEKKIIPGINTFSNITIAKKMVFELPGFTDLTGPYNQSVTIKLGKWVKTGETATSTSSSFSNGKSYIVASTVPDDQKASIHSKTSDLANDAAVVQNAVFTASGDGTTTGSFVKEIPKYTFTANDSTSVTKTLNGNLQAVVSQLNEVSGISAKLVNTGKNSSGDLLYSIVVNSTSTGLNNGFQITAGGVSRWETSSLPAGNTDGNNFSQLASDATFTLDGVTVSRTSNTIDDLIDGVSINLKADQTNAIQYTGSRSEINVKNTVEDVITVLNDYKKELDRLTFIDVDGGNNGPLAMDPAVGMLKSKLKKLTMSALSGHSEQNIYLSTLGIKTNSSGEYYFDKVTFDKTYSTNPHHFNALKDDNISTSVLNATVTKSQFTEIPEGIHEVKYDTPSSTWKFGDTALTRVAYNGGSKFTSVTYPGLVIHTTDASPSAFNVLVGKSFSQSMVELTDTVFSLSSSIKTAETGYKTSNTDIANKLADLDIREKLLKTRYTTQFGAMEQAMSQFNSTKTLLDNFVESWKKQK